MVEYFRDKSFSFRLKDLNDYEEVSIWKAFNFKEELIGSDGRQIKFPIKEGEMIGLDGINRTIQQMATLPGSIFKTLYRNMALKRTYTRAVYVQNIEFWYQFSQASNGKLKDLIKSISTLGQNPLFVNFKQIFNKSATTPMDYYKIEIEQTVNSPIPMTPPGIPQYTPIQQPVQIQGVNTTITQPIQGINIVLTEKELEIYNSILGIPNRQPLENFTKIFVNNGITDLHKIEDIYNTKYIIEHP